MRIEPQQHAILTQLAKRQGRSVAAITREVISLGLAQLVDREIVSRRAHALEQADQIAANMQRLDRDVVADLAQLREELDEQTAGSD